MSNHVVVFMEDAIDATAWGHRQPHRPLNLRSRGGLHNFMTMTPVSGQRATGEAATWSMGSSSGKRNGDRSGIRTNL